MYNFDQVANPDLIKFNSVELNNCNPNSNHKLGKEAKLIVENIKNQFKKWFDYENVEFIPGGGSMANRRAVLGSVPGVPKRISKNVFRNIIIVSPVEHKSINETVINQLRSLGYEIIMLTVVNDGNIEINELIRIIRHYRNRIALVSIMNVNNETGKIMGIKGLCKMVKEIDDSIIFHSDVSQGVYNLYLQEDWLPDIVSFSVYKLGGPHLGVVLSKCALNDEYFGTEDVVSIQATGFVVDHYFRNVYGNSIMTAYVKELVKHKVSEISEKLGVIIIDVSGDNSVSHIQSYLVPGYEAKIIQDRLSEKNIFIGTGSACSSQSGQGSHVVSALGYSSQMYSLIRFSYNETVVDGIDYMGNVLYDVLSFLKEVVGDNSERESKTKIVKLAPIKKMGGMYSNFPESCNVPDNLGSRMPIFDCIKLSIGELYLKGKNRGIYDKMLIKNIRRFIKVNKEDMLIKNGIYIIKNNKGSISGCKKIPGIAKIVPCSIIKRSDGDLCEMLSFISGIIEGELVLADVVKFRVTAKYTNVTNYHNVNLNDFVIHLGQWIVDRFGEKVYVDLKNYDVNIQVTIFNDLILINTVSYAGVGGLPVGTSGRGLLIKGENSMRNQLSMEMAMQRGSYVKECETLSDETVAKYDYVIMESSGYNDVDIYNRLKELEVKYEKPVISLTNLIFLEGDIKNSHNKTVLMLLSGGIDSPVASHLLIEAGYKVDFIHFTTEVDKISNIIEIRDILNKKTDKEAKILVVDFREIQNLIVKVGDESYRTLMYKVYMILIANKIAERKYDYIATGNALGQVASQTIDNIKITHLISEMAQIVPLFGYNKNDIVNIAKEIGTFSPSICDGTNDCCVMFMPKHPVTRGSYKTVLKIIQKMGNVDFSGLKIVEY